MTSQEKVERVDLWAPGFGEFGGGITAFSRELAAALPSRNWLFGKLDVPGVWNGADLWGAGNFPDASRTIVFTAGLAMSGVLHRPAKVISTHLNYGPVARFIRQVCGTPYCLVAHGIDVSSTLSNARKQALREASQLIAVSNWTKERLVQQCDVDPSLIQVLPNTYDDQRFSPGKIPAYLKDRYEITLGERVILTVARLDRGEGYKGYDRILQALPSIRETCGPVRYIIAGRGEDRTRLEVLARELEVEDAVTFAGFVPDEELVDHYRLADVFAMPSTGEGFGIVFLEAMGCGTPVLGGNRDGSVDALDHGKLGKLVDPTSVEAIAGGLIDLLKRQGPEWWFDREALSNAVRETYGREAFRKRVGEIFGA